MDFLFVDCGFTCVACTPPPHTHKHMQVVALTKKLGEQQQQEQGQGQQKTEMDEALRAAQASLLKQVGSCGCGCRRPGTVPLRTRHPFPPTASQTPHTTTHRLTHYTQYTHTT